MYLSTLDSLVGFLWWVLSESLSIAVDGDSFCFALCGPFYGVSPCGGVLIPPFPLTPLYGPSVGLWRGFIFLVVLVEPFQQKSEDCCGQRQTGFPRFV